MKSNFILIHTNVYSCNCKLDEFMCKIEHIGATLHVKVISETWIADDLCGIEMPGFSAYHCKRTRTSQGGVTVFVETDLESDLSFSVELERNSETHAIIAVYRPPSKLIHDFNIIFLQLNNSISNPYIFLGDFNLDTNSNVRRVAGNYFTDRRSCPGYEPMSYMSILRRGKRQKPQPVFMVFILN